MLRHFRFRFNTVKSKRENLIFSRDIRLCLTIVHRVVHNSEKRKKVERNAVTLI